MLDYFISLFKDGDGKPSLSNFSTMYSLILSTIGLVVDFFYGYPAAVDLAKVIIPTVIGARVARSVIGYGMDSVYNSPRGDSPRGNNNAIR